MASKPGNFRFLQIESSCASTLWIQNGVSHLSEGMRVLFLLGNSYLPKPWGDRAVRGSPFADPQHHTSATSRLIWAHNTAETTFPLQFPISPITPQRCSHSGARQHLSLSQWMCYLGLEPWQVSVSCRNLVTFLCVLAKWYWYSTWSRGSFLC